MKLHSDITINGKLHQKGSEISWLKIYPFFLLHMGIFGLSGFYMAYFVSDIELPFLFMHGGIAIAVYLTFYLTIFGREEVKWMFINAVLGLFGILAEIRWLLASFDRSLSDYPVSLHVIPFLYYVLYQFLLRQALLDITGAREDEIRKRNMEKGYIVISTTVYVLIYLLA